MNETAIPLINWTLLQFGFAGFRRPVIGNVRRWEAGHLERNPRGVHVPAAKSPSHQESQYSATDKERYRGRAMDPDKS
jgi:hypothetical protein